MKERNQAFLGSLESLRGLAALSVALFHSFHLIPVNGERIFDKRIWELHGATETVMRLLMVPFNGGAAVILFFVLSGFVLHLSLQKVACLSLGEALKFAVRRFLRIYPAVAVNLLVFVGLATVLGKVLPGAGFTPFTIPQIVDNFLLQDYQVNGVTWTLLVEIGAIPCILVTELAGRKYGVAGIVGCVMLFFIVAVTPLNFKIEFVKSYYLFSLGMLVSYLYLRGDWQPMKRAGAIAMIAVLALMAARILVSNWSKWTVLIEGLSSAALIGALVFNSSLAVHAILKRKALRFLGRISFSFYLCQPITLWLTSNLMSWQAGQWMPASPILASTLLAIVTVLAAIPLAMLSYACVERPMTKLGKAI